MDIEMDLEDMALGEVTLPEATAIVNAALRAPSHDEMACELYETLRSWLWKTLEARRRDEELIGWMALFSIAAVRIGETSADLATRLEGFMELLHASIMAAKADEHRNPFTHGHATRALAHLHSNGGQLSRERLMEASKMTPHVLSRVMGPLIDRGFVTRQVEDGDACYRLTREGRDATSRHLA